VKTEDALIEIDALIERLRIDLIAIIARALNTSGDVLAKLSTAAIGDQAFVNILATLPISRISRVARAGEARIFILAGRVWIAIVRVRPALIYIIAQDAVSAVARVT